MGAREAAFPFPLFCRPPANALPNLRSDILGTQIELVKELEHRHLDSEVKTHQLQILLLVALHRDIKLHLPHGSHREARKRNYSSARVDASPRVGF